MGYTKMKQSYCELILPTLVQTVTFSSPFQGHRQCDKLNFWRQFLCGCYLGHQTVSREHVPFLLACGPAKRWFRLFVLKRYVSPLFAPVCHPPGDSDSESVTIAFWLHLPTQWYIGCHRSTKSLQTQMTQIYIPSFIHFFLMKTQEWKDCYVHRNIGIRGSNAKYKTGMKELNTRYMHFQMIINNSKVSTW